MLKRTSIWSAKKNKIEAVKRWLNSPNFKVSPDSFAMEKIIKQIRFIWTVVEKAITTFESIWISILSVESITPMTAK